MPCNLLHVMEDPDRDTYADPSVKDVVGMLPRIYCAHCTPLRRLAPHEVLKCLDRDGPCWKPPGMICD